MQQQDFDYLKAAHNISNHDAMLFFLTGIFLISMQCEQKKKK